MDAPQTTLSLLINRTKADAAYDELRRRILLGELEPGERLDQEAVALSLGLSTTPVREALRRLEADDLVHRSAHKDVTIAPLSRREVAEIYAVRVELDGLAVTLATQAASDEELAVIRTLLPKRGTSGGPAQDLVSNRTFHRALYSASHNAVLIRVLESLWDRSDRYRAVVLRDPRQAKMALSEHEAIFNAVAARDAELAGTLMRRHISQSLAGIDAMLATRESATAS